jgi:crotonobetainyl-CoA:carnitine CoA-transferase CaiB-like acyl-CoA transferase
VFTNLRVIEFGQYLAGPVAGMLLGDLGADVIKVERPGGDPARELPAYQTWNRNKRVIELDLRSSEGVARARELAADADVLIDGLRPGVLERAGLDAPALRRGHTGLIYCTLPGFAAEVQPEGTAAWEPIVSAAAGLFRPPTETGKAVFTPLPFASMYAGVLAADSIAAALYFRDRTGEGQEVEVPIHSALFLAAGYALQRVRGAEQTLGRGLMPMVTTYRCADDRWVQFHNGLPHFIEGFIASEGLQSWQEEGLFDRNGWQTNPEVAAKLQGRLTDLFAQRTSLEWETRLSDAGLCCTVCRTVEEWLDHPHPRQAGFVVELPSPRGPMLQPGRMIQNEQTTRRPLQPVQQVDAGQIAWRGDRLPVPAPGAATSSPLPRRPLEGIRVLDLCLILAGPTCGRTLAELGADVIKIDSPRPTIIDAFWLDTNRGKRSVTLDLKQTAGREALWKLIESADVVVENFRKGVSERLGIGYEQVAARFPEIIYASMNCYGYEGPFADRPGWEQLAQATSGLQVRYGGRDAQPRLAPYAVNDYATGVAAALGVVGALHERALTGRGQRTTVALVAMAGLLQSLYMFDYPGYDRHEIEGQDALGFSAFSRLYECSDDWIYLHCPPEARTPLASLTGFEAIFAGQDLHAEHGPDSSIATAIAALIVTGPAVYWLPLLNSVGAAAVRAVTATQLRDDPGVQAAGLIRTTHSPVRGDIEHVGIPHRFSRTPAENGPAAPEPGADTAAILRELGYSDDAIRAMVEADGAAIPAGS